MYSIILQSTTQIQNPTHSNEECESSTQEIEKLPKENLLFDYLEENDFILYDFTNELKEYWEHLGFMTTLKHTDVSKILYKTMIVSELEELNFDSSSSEKDYLSDEYE